ncbi:hypothetical protein [Deinococcus misasensis]|uniref:hypothetical protein n=1 Tax=Deinococcus misasensis TaxID=392413 RepID=UPI00054E391B|nr:hypothetical protein [Deinococcus misasensis]
MDVQIFILAHYSSSSVNTGTGEVRRVFLSLARTYDDAKILAERDAGRELEFKTVVQDHWEAAGPKKRFYVILRQRMHDPLPFREDTEEA